MDESTPGFRQLANLFDRSLRQLLAIGANRLDLLSAEVQEEREHLLRSIHLALGVAVLGMLAGMTFTAGLVLLLWNHSPVVALAAVTIGYGAAAVALGRRLSRCLRDWQTFPDSLEQLRRDRARMERSLP